MYTFREVWCEIAHQPPSMVATILVPIVEYGDATQVSHQQDDLHTKWPTNSPIAEPPTRPKNLGDLLPPATNKEESNSSSTLGEESPTYHILPIQGFVVNLSQVNQSITTFNANYRNTLDKPLSTQTEVRINSFNSTSTQRDHD